MKIKSMLVCMLMMLLCITASASGSKVGKTMNNRMNAVVSEFRNCDGVEVIKIGSLPIALARTVANLSGDLDSDDLAALSLIDGVKGLLVMEYDECTPSLKTRINSRIAKVLKGTELLMSAKDDEDNVSIHGALSADGDYLDDVIIFTGEELICIYGHIAMKDISAVVASEL